LRQPVTTADFVVRDGDPSISGTGNEILNASQGLLDIGANSGFAADT
jgi:hypothetical protein